MVREYRLTSNEVSPKGLIKVSLCNSRKLKTYLPRATQRMRPATKRLREVKASERTSQSAKYTQRTGQSVCK